MLLANNFSDKKCLIIGCGSIGLRHAEILGECGLGVTFVTKRTDVHGFQRFSSIESALKKQSYDYVIISNKTSDHYRSFVELDNSGYKGLLLVEKPLFCNPEEINEISRENIFVAYNLRFHPVIQKIKSLVSGSDIYSMQVYVGQYLPDWRPGSDYSKTYSVSRKEGGGALRDLSHELDYITWLTDGLRRVASLGGKFSSLTIDSDDVFCLLMETRRCPAVVLQMNYLDRVPRREIIINLEEMSLRADLFANTLHINNECHHFEMDRNATYLGMHQAILQGDSEDVCSLAQGLETVNLIDLAERAARERIWVER